MLIFKSINYLDQLSTEHPAYTALSQAITQLVDAYATPTHPFVADEHGYIVLVEASDMDSPLELPELKGHWIDVMWEGAFVSDGYIHAIYLVNNEFGITFLIPDAEWLSSELRKCLNALLER